MVKCDIFIDKKGNTCNKVVPKTLFKDGLEKTLQTLYNRNDKTKGKRKGYVCKEHRENQGL